MASLKPVFIQEDQVRKHLRWDSLVLAMERAMANFSQGRDGGVIQPVRTQMVIPSPQGERFFMTMPGYSAKENALACKLLSFFPSNTEMGLPSHIAAITLFESTTGALKAVVDGDLITAMRTAASSVVASKYLVNAREAADGLVLAVLGRGTQAHSHVAAFCHCFNITETRIWNWRKQGAVEFCDELKKDGKTAVVCDSVEEAVTGADVIVTTTNTTTPLVKGSWVKPGAHINAVGACRPDRQELSSDLMNSAVVYVDTREAALQEAGDVILSGANIYGEIGEIVNGTKKAYKEKTTVFKSLGMAVEDVVTAELVYNEYMKKQPASL